MATAIMLSAITAEMSANCPFHQIIFSIFFPSTFPDFEGKSRFCQPAVLTPRATFFIYFLIIELAHECSPCQRPTQKSYRPRASVRVRRRHAGPATSSTNKTLPGRRAHKLAKIFPTSKTWFGAGRERRGEASWFLFHATRDFKSMIFAPDPPSDSQIFRVANF